MTLIGKIIRKIKMKNICTRIDKEAPYLSIIALLYNSIGVPLYYLLIDETIELFNGLRVIRRMFTKLLRINVTVDNALKYITKYINSKNLKDLIDGYRIISTISTLPEEYMERITNEVLHRIKNRWENYSHSINTLVELFLLLVFTIAIILMLGTLMNTSIANTQGTLIPLLIIIMLLVSLSVLVIDLYSPTSNGRYKPKRKNITISLLLLMITLPYILVIHNSGYNLNIVSTYIIILLVLSPIAIDNLRYFIYEVGNINDEITLIMDFIYTYIRYGLTPAEALNRIIKGETKSQFMKRLLVKLQYLSTSTSSENMLEEVDNTKVSMFSSLIYGLIKAGYIEYDRILKIKDVFNSIVVFENTIRKQLLPLAIIAIILPSITLFLLGLFNTEVAGIYSMHTRSQWNNILSLSTTSWNINSVLGYILIASTIISVGLNTILSKAIDFTITSFWRTYISLILLVVTYFVLLRLCTV